MKLNYRGNDYTFWGRELLPGKPGSITNIINAFDTESVRTTKAWECQLISYSHPGGECHKFVDPNEIPLLILFNIIFSINPRTNAPKKEQPVYYVYAHNLEYDWSQLIKNCPALYELTRTGQVVKPLTLKLGGYEIKFVRGVFQGSSPFLSLEINKDGTGATLELRDTAGFYKTSLAKLAKTFNIPDKLTSKDLGQIDFRNVPDTDPDKKLFIDYVERDAYITRMVAEEIRKLHLLFNFNKLKVSGPAFAAAGLVSEVPQDQAIITNKGNKVALQLALDAYRGGRTGGVYHGPVKDMWVYDIHSSYPAAMRSLPSFSTMTEVITRDDKDGPIKHAWAMAMLKEYPCTLLRISGEETDPKYPTLVTTLPDGKLCPVYGKFENLATTGPEVLAGIMTGGLTNVTFHQVIIYFDRKGATSPFKNFVDKAYELKANSEKDSPPYTAAKLLLNSGYGKLIESHKGIKARLKENVTVFICEPTELEKKSKKNIKHEQAQMYYRMYIDALSKGQPPGAVINHYTKSMINAGLFKKGEWVPINDLQLNDHEFGFYVTPPAAALVTGIARARLYLGIKYCQALYWDTDSIFTPKHPKEVERILAAIPAGALPAGVIPVTFGPGLGEYGIDLPAANGYLSGVKRYHLTHKKYNWPTNDAPQPQEPVTEKVKMAIHGMPNMPKEKSLLAIKALATGADFSYKEKPSPIGVKSASLDMAGVFLNEEELSQVESKFFLDMRLKWEGDGPWSGEVIPYLEIMAHFEAKEFNKHLLQIKNKTKKDFAASKKELKDLIIRLGGLAADAPKALIRKAGITHAEMVEKLKFKYPLESEEDLNKLINIYFEVK